MSHRVRRPVLAGNWKMNKGPQDATSFFAAFLDNYTARKDRTIIFFPPALSFAASVRAVGERSDIHLGVQNIHWEENGAFTGEISAAIAAQAEAEWVLAGHSERRHVFGETDEETGRKCAAALAAGLIPIACIGETLEQREAGQLQEVLLRQLDAVLNAIPADAADRIVIAYEPVWAIGTGVNATPGDAAEAHAVIRARLTERYGKKPAGHIPILYGGSVKPDNAAHLLSAAGVDGLLVGGASLDPVAFARISAV
ncbi:MAG TPA: triose-phosphate isomerase [Longimicrobiales bacterium]|nr:triose-phosphate isomerase [Longimicrobiales bacterium]